MAEEKVTEVPVDNFHGDDSDKGKDDLNQSKGDSDEMSGSQSDGDDHAQRHGSDNDHKQRKGRRPRRLKGGKRHNRKHRPYSRTSCDERAKKSGDGQAPNREDLFASGHPLAPFNTTQFLIEDHVKVSPHLNHLQSPLQLAEDSGGEAPGVQETTDGPPDEALGDASGSPSGSALGRPDMSQYDQEFVAAYDSVREERLYSMSREDLIRMTSRLMQRVGAGLETLGGEVGMGDSRRSAEKESPSATTPLSSCN